MKLDRETAHYIVGHYYQYMTEAERAAHLHLSTTMKATEGRSDAAAQKEAQSSWMHSRWLSNDPDVLHLASEGFEAFKARTAARILQECGDKVLLNRCPKCDKLARTPNAKQCRFCHHDWHG